MPSPNQFETTQNSTHCYQATLRDELGAVIPAASLTTLTLTLTNKSDNSLINARNAQNVLNANGVTIDSAGNLVWTGTPLDNPIINTSRQNEIHVALFQYTWNSGTKGAPHAVELNCVRVSNVPAYPAQ